MTKIEIDLTDEQIEKLNQLEKKGIGLGEVIDGYYDGRNEISKLLKEIESNPSFSEKIVDNTLDVESKAENLDENFGEGEESYDMKIKYIRHNISWAKDIFKL